MYTISLPALRRKFIIVHMCIFLCDNKYVNPGVLHQTWICALVLPRLLSMEHNFSHTALQQQCRLLLTPCTQSLAPHRYRKKTTKTFNTCTNRFKGHYAAPRKRVEKQRVAFLLIQTYRPSACPFPNRAGGTRPTSYFLFGPVRLCFTLPPDHPNTSGSGKKSSRVSTSVCDFSVGLLFSLKENFSTEWEGNKRARSRALSLHTGQDSGAGRRRSRRSLIGTAFNT